MQVSVKNLVARIDRRKLTNNTQRTLLSLLTAKTEWVSRSSIRVNSVGARIRDLRKPEFGGFQVECASARELGRPVRKTKGIRQTFYRLTPSSVTSAKVISVFEGVIATTQK